MTLDRRRFVLTAAALPALSFAGTACAGPKPPMSLADMLKKTGAPAVAGAVTTRDALGPVEAAGVRRLGDPTPVAADDLWHIGSNAKAMTTALYARLVEQGRAAWGATLPALFPDLKVDPAWASTRIEDLMAHRAGITDKVVGDPMAWIRRTLDDAAPAVEQRTRMTAATLAAPPRGKAGKFEYSNINYVIIGAAIERITGKSWEEAITAELFQPLGMATAGFGAPTGDQPWGHGKWLTGKYAPIEPGPLADNPVVLGPAGRVHLSLADHAKFLRLFLTDGGGFLSPASITRLTTPWGGEGANYALGWGVLPGKPWSNGAILQHEGSNTLWNAVAAVAPGAGFAVMTVSNSEARGGAEASRMFASQLVASRV